VQALISVAKAIDSLNQRLGSWVAWLALIMVLVQFVVVLMRYVFGMGSIAMQESIIYMHGILFMVGAGYTLLHDGHVRVDIFYREATPKHKAKVDIFGVLAFLLPVCILIWIYSWPYVVSAWEVYEGSKETSGIQAVFLLKTIVLVFCVLVALQGISMLIHSLAVLLEKEPPKPSEEHEGI
jgi:TRAP-type mannitol/chloroaromatic compound transport system permease small subunit